jgi:hypothetical protein
VSGVLYRSLWVPGISCRQRGVRAMVGTDYLRFGFYTQEQDERILRVKLVFPICHLFEAQAETRLFVTTRQQFAHHRLGLVVN